MAGVEKVHNLIQVVCHSEKTKHNLERDLSGGQMYSSLFRVCENNLFL